MVALIFMTLDMEVNMQLGLINLLGLASNAVGFIQKAFNGSAKGDFDAELSTAMTGSKGTKDALKELLGSKDAMDEEAFAALLSVPSGMLTFQFMTAMKEMGLQTSDIQLLLNGSGDNLSDGALSSILSFMGLGQDEITGLMADSAMKAEVKTQLGDSFKSLIDKMASKDGIDPGSLLKLTASDAASVEAIIERIGSGKPFANAASADGISSGNESAALASQETAAIIAMINKDVPLATGEIRILVSHALKKALLPHIKTAGEDGISEDPTAAIKVSDMVDTAGRDLGISKDSLKDLFFETDPLLRQQAVDQVTSQVNSYLNSQGGKELNAEAANVIAFLKKAMSEDEFSGIDKTLKLLFPGQTVTDAKITMDKSLYAALVKNLADSGTGSVFENQIKQVVDQLRQVVPAGMKNGEGQVTMRLHPPMLGRVDIDMTMQDGQLHATFKTDQVITRDILLQNISVLKEALADQGIKATQFSVMTSFDERSPRDTYAFAGHNRQGHGSGHNGQGTEGRGQGFREEDSAVYAQANYSAGILDKGLDLFA